MSPVDRHLCQRYTACAPAIHVMQESNDAKITHAGAIYARTFSETKFSAVGALQSCLCNVKTSTIGTDIADNYCRSYIETVR